MGETQKIIEQLAGNIDVESVTGQKTTFFMRLPASSAMVQVNDRWQRTVGVVVDKIVEEKSVLFAQLLPAKDEDSQLDIQFIKGLASGDESMIVMDIDKLLSLEALG